MLNPSVQRAAHVAELADALASGASVSNDVQVQVLSWALQLVKGLTANRRESFFLWQRQILFRGQVRRCARRLVDESEVDTGVTVTRIGFGFRGLSPVQYRLPAHTDNTQYQAVPGEHIETPCDKNPQQPFEYKYANDKRHDGSQHHQIAT